MNDYEISELKEIYQMLDSAIIELMNTSIPPGSRREEARNLVISAMEKLDLISQNNEEKAKCYSCQQNSPVGGDTRVGNHCKDCIDLGYVSVACPDCYNRNLTIFGIPSEKLLIIG